jgi:ribosomal protein S18 acetylase RimI-like enzyme
VDEREDEVRIVDIALLPSFQKQGIGTHLLKGTLSKAQRTGKSVGIHVERFNPALKWYVQLGFRQVSDQGVYLFLKWQPQGE